MRHLLDLKDFNEVFVNNDNWLQRFCELQELKSDPHLPKVVLFQNWFICCSECLLKMIKNAFYFILKLFSFSRYSKFFVLTFWSCRKKTWLELRLISKFMTSQSGQQIITMHILSNISRSKDNKTVKFGQLIKYNQRNIFLQKPCRKWGRETSSRSLFVF